MPRSKTLAALRMAVAKPRVKGSVLTIYYKSILPIAHPTSQKLCALCGSVAIFPRPFSRIPRISRLNFPFIFYVKKLHSTLINTRFVHFRLIFANFPTIAFPPVNIGQNPISGLPFFQLTDR